MATEDRNGALHSESNGRFVSKNKSDDEKRKALEPIFNSNGHLNETTRLLANGGRRSVFHILNQDEIQTIKNEAKEIGIDETILRFNQGTQTGIGSDTGFFYIRGDILPDINSTNPRDRLSIRAVLAHEYYGHYMNHPSEYPVGDWRDEYRASRDAALKAPNLSDKDRACLMIDAYERQKEAGVFEGYDQVAKEIIYGRN